MTNSFSPLSGRCRLLALAAAMAAAAPVMLSHAPAAAASPGYSAERSTYVLFGKGSRSTTMSGSTDDLRHARSLRVGSEAMLYVRDGNDTYVIRDAATLRKAEMIFEPQRVVGEQQAELGSRQAALGSRQAALGQQQATIGFQQANATPRRAVELGRQQAALGRQQHVLGEQQHALGREQNALGREQHRLSREAKVRLQGLLAEAVQSGLAQPVD